MLLNLFLHCFSFLVYSNHTKQPDPPNLDNLIFFQKPIQAAFTLRNEVLNHGSHEALYAVS